MNASNPRIDLPSGAVGSVEDPGTPWSGRRSFLARSACCGINLALGSFHLQEAVALPATTPHWPAAVQALWQRSWQGVRPASMVDVHVHLLGHTGNDPDDDAGAWINPRTLSPFAFGDWVRRWAIEQASGVAGHRAALSQRYIERLASLWSDFPAGARPLLLAFDACVDADGRLDESATMFRTGNDYAANAAQDKGWGWIASIHPDRADAIDRLQAAKARGASAVKWLPSAMGIDPSSARYKRYYAELARLGLFLLTHAGEEKAVSGANAHENVNPLLLRRALDHGVRVILAHCASLGEAIDFDHPHRIAVPAFQLFARMMDDPATGTLVHGDISAVTQINRSTADLQMLLVRTDWHGRLMHGSDYPLPGLGWLTSVQRLAAAGLLDVGDVGPLKALQSLNPLAFDFALKRSMRWQGRTFAAGVFDAGLGMAHA